LWAALVLAGCRGDGHHATPDGREFPHATAAIDRHAPTDEELATLFFSGLAGGAVRLSGGVATRGDGSRVEWVREVRLAADITGNGTDEAVVVLREQRPGMDDQLYVAIVGSADGHPQNMATLLLPGVTAVTAGQAGLGRVVLDVVAAGPVRLTFSFARGVLKLQREEPLPPSGAAPPSRSDIK
jgi:hypothetical protein